LIADDHAILRAGLRLLVSAQPDMQVAGEAGTASEALEMTHQLDPDVLTLDLVMPGVRSIETVLRLARECPRTRVLILTMHDDPTMLRAVLTAGGAGYIVKTAADAEFIAAIRAVHEGRTFLSLGLSSSVVQSVLMGDVAARSTTAQSKSPSALSAREHEVLQLLVQGYTNQETADRLFLGVKTVETHRARLMAKLDLNSRADLVRYASNQGLVGQASCAE
jgi:two-component system response regulator NreC